MLHAALATAVDDGPIVATGRLDTLEARQAVADDVRGQRFDRSATWEFPVQQDTQSGDDGLAMGGGLHRGNERHRRRPQAQCVSLAELDSYQVNLCAEPTLQRWHQDARPPPSLVFKTPANVADDTSEVTSSGVSHCGLSSTTNARVLTGSCMM